MTNNIAGCCVYEIKRHLDNRGCFQEIFSSRRYDFEPKQINVSFSKKNVIRGIHYATYPKLCTCVSGCLYDVVVDLRKESPTYLQWYGEWLTEENGKQMLVPARCGHGFFAGEENTILVYAQEGLYDPEKDVTIHWKDASIGIIWPEASEYILSEKDNDSGFLAKDSGNYFS